jgi:hypothetical protein
LKAERKTPTWMDGIGGEAVDKFLEFILDTDHVEFIKQLSASYPVTAELLDVLSKSVQEKISNRLKETAERVTRKRTQDPSLSLAKLIEQEVASLGIVPDVSRAIPRMKSVEPDLDAREAEVDAANRRFETDLHQEIENETRQMQTQKSAVERVQNALGSVPDSKPEEEKEMSLSLGSLEKVRERTRLYQDQLGDLVRSSNPSKHTELIQILGAAHFRAVMTLPSKSAPNSASAVPGGEPAPGEVPKKKCCGGYSGPDPQQHDLTSTRQPKTYRMLKARSNSVTSAKSIAWRRRAKCAAHLGNGSITPKNTPNSTHLWCPRKYQIAQSKGSRSRSGLDGRPARISEAWRRGREPGRRYRRAARRRVAIR